MKKKNKSNYNSKAGMFKPGSLNVRIVGKIKCEVCGLLVYKYILSDINMSRSQYQLGFCLVIELVQGGSATNRAKLSI